MREVFRGLFHTSIKAAMHAVARMIGQAFDEDWPQWYKGCDVEASRLCL